MKIQTMWRSKLRAVFAVGGITATVLALMLGSAGPALAGPTYGTVTGTFSPNSAKQGATVGLMISASGAPQGQQALTDDLFGAEFDSKRLQFSGSVSGASCKVSALTGSPTYDTSVWCTEARTSGTKSDTLFFTIKQNAPIGATSVVYGVLYEYAKGGNTVSLQINAADPHCDRGNVNVKGFCVPNPVADIVTELINDKTFALLSPAQKSKVIVKVLIKSGVRTGFLAALTIIDAIIANEGHAS